MSKKELQPVQYTVIRDGVYQFRMMYNGKRHQQSLKIPADGTKANRDLAEKKACRWANYVRDGRAPGRAAADTAASASYTVDEFADRMVRAQRSSVKLTTFLNLQNTARLLGETVVDGTTWSDRDIRSITETDCRAMLTTLQFTIHKSQN